MNSNGQRLSLMSRLKRALVRPFSAPRIDMREDYEKVRWIQRQTAALQPRYHGLDREVISADGTHEIPVRVFQPKEKRRDELLLFFHGGGWVTGDIESYTPACSTMAELTGCIVASVDYRLAPEHPFPAGLEDCYHVARLLMEDPSRGNLDNVDNIVLVGDSAGGNLAAIVSQRLRNAGLPVPSRQILLYPVTHWDHNPETSPFDSVRSQGTDHRLTNTEVDEYFELYAPDPAQRKQWEVAPLLSEDFTRQPRTLMITAELDLLRDEGEAYAAALESAGNEVQTHRVPRAVHGIITLPRFARSLREVYEVINDFLEDS